MKIYLTKNDVLEILASHFGLEVLKDSICRRNESVIEEGDIYWEGNEEKG